MATQKKTKQKRNRRSKSKYPALRPELNLKSRTELIDMDYVDKLNDKEKEWLNTFMEEYTNANFQHKKKVLHSTKALKKDCYDRNNARNRDIHTKHKAAGELKYLDDLNDLEKVSKTKQSLGEESEDSTDSSNE